MSRKSFIMIAMVGGYVSGLLGADFFSLYWQAVPLAASLAYGAPSNSMNNTNRGDF